MTQETNLDIVGGLYRESCEVPSWSKTFGSGGRAAAALANLAPETNLHTFADRGFEADYAHLQDLGVSLNLYSSAERVAFSYFHPLSKPHMSRTGLGNEGSSVISVEARTVLRFGMIEGDAVVKAARAVYDPQIGSADAPYSQNGSAAETLAVVLNEQEAEKSGGASALISKGHADVVVLKRGPSGASVLSSQREANIPAYWASSVFKIGSGDVFSAAFAYYWGHEQMDPERAADLASRATADYCETKMLPLRAPTIRRPTGGKTHRRPRITVDGVATTLGRRYILEEIRYILDGMGIDAQVPALEGGIAPLSDARLVVVDGYDCGVGNFDHRTVFLRETGAEERGSAYDADYITDDLTTAVYWAIWFAIENVHETKKEK